MGEYFLNMLDLAHHLANANIGYELTGLMYNPLSNAFTAYYSTKEGSSFIYLNHDSVNISYEAHQIELEKHYSLTEV